MTRIPAILAFVLLVSALSFPLNLNAQPANPPPLATSYTGTANGPAVALKMLYITLASEINLNEALVWIQITAPVWEKGIQRTTWKMSNYTDKLIPAGADHGCSEHVGEFDDAVAMWNDRNKQRLSLELYRNRSLRLYAASSSFLRCFNDNVLRYENELRMKIAGEE